MPGPFWCQSVCERVEGEGANKRRWMGGCRSLQRTDGKVGELLEAALATAGTAPTYASPTHPHHTTHPTTLCSLHSMPATERLTACAGPSAPWPRHRHRHAMYWRGP